MDIQWKAEETERAVNHLAQTERGTHLLGGLVGIHERFAGLDSMSQDAAAFLVSALLHDSDVTRDVLAKYGEERARQGGKAIRGLCAEVCCPPSLPLDQPPSQPVKNLG